MSGKNSKLAMKSTWKHDLEDSKPNRPPKDLFSLLARKARLTPVQLAVDSWSLASTSNQQRKVTLIQESLPVPVSLQQGEDF